MTQGHSPTVAKGTWGVVKNVLVLGEIQDRKLRDMILFALKCSRNPQSLVEGDFEQLRGHELKQSEIVELIAMSAFAVYANIIADATAMSPDEMFDTIG